MPLRIVNEGIVWAGPAGSRRQSCAFPSVCTADSGRWLCAFRAAPTKAGVAGQHVLLTWSDDCGRTWSAPIQPFDPPEIGGVPGLFRGCHLTSLDADQLLAALMWVDGSVPAAPFFNEQTEGLLDTRIFLSRSDDGGGTWSRPERVGTEPFDQPTPLTGPVLCLPNGELACQFELNKHYEDVRPWVHKSILMFSRDGGHSWPDHAVASHDPENRVFYWDQRPAVVHGGRLLNVFWTFDRERAEYRNIHGRESGDHGRTWSKPWNLGIPGQPAAPVPLADGHLALVYVDRSSAPRIVCRISVDGGRSWPAASAVELYRAAATQTAGKNSMQDAWREMEHFSVGLPAAASLSSHSFLVVYYVGSHTDQTAIRWTHCAWDSRRERHGT